MRQAGIAGWFACPLIIVAGTNGKGSVVAMIEAIATAAGYRVCSYTSPHLLRYNERLRIDGAEISDAELCAAFERIDHTRDNVPLTYFEIGTLAAIDLCQFAVNMGRAELVVMEIGLGGRLDAANVMQPDVSVITSVALDHTDWLNDSLAAIAVEKAGVMRPQRLTIIGQRDPPRELYRSVQQIAARCMTLGQEIRVHTTADGWGVEGGGTVFEELPPPALAGARQVDNAASAIMALQQLGAPGIDREAICRGLAAVRLPGRLQRIDGHPQVLFDVAHNPAAMQTVVDWCRQHPVPGRTRLVLAMLADEPVAELSSLLSSLADDWYIAGLQDVDRGLSGAALAATIGPEVPDDKLTDYENVEEACAAAMQCAAGNDRILVTGSFHTVAVGMRYIDAKE